MSTVSAVTPHKIDEEVTAEGHSLSRTARHRGDISVFACQDGTFLISSKQQATKVVSGASSAWRETIWRNDGNFLCFNQWEFRPQATRTLLKLDCETGSFSHIPALGKYSAYIGDQADELLSLDHTNELMKWNVVSERRSSRVTFDKQLEIHGVAPSGAFAVVLRKDEEIAVVKLADSSEVFSLPVNSATSISWSPMVDRILITHYDRSFTRDLFNGTRLAELKHHGRNCHASRWVNNSEVECALNTGAILTFDVDTNQIQREE